MSAPRINRPAPPVRLVNVTIYLVAGVVLTVSGLIVWALSSLL